MGVGKGHSRDGNPWRKHNLLDGGNGGGLGAPTSPQNPHELGPQGPTFKPQEARWAASHSWAPRASSAKGCGMPTGIPVMGLLPPWGHSAPQATSPASCRATTSVPTPPSSAISRQSDRLSAWISGCVLSPALTPSAGHGQEEECDQAGLCKHRHCVVPLGL